MRHHLLFLGLALCLLSTACNLQAKQTAPDTATADTDRLATEGTAFAKTDDTGTPYDFANPTADFDMPKDLTEISGLTVLDETHLGAIQDEKAHLYIIDFATGAVDQELDFGGEGDYEGIEYLDGRLFVMRSDGEIEELLGWRTGEIKTREYDGDLGSNKCNAEGLGAEGHRLLVVCKEDGKGDRNEVHAFDLATNEFSDGEVFEVDADDVSGKHDLRPSGIARHPITGDIVVLSSKHESLVVVDLGGHVKAEWDIKPAGLEQPEGIAFLPNGDLFLSSEGKEGPGKVMRFAWRG